MGSRQRETEEYRRQETEWARNARQRQTEWEKSLNWPEVGPKLIAALEDIDWALSSGKPKAASEIVGLIFTEIGRDKLDKLPE